MRAFGTLIVLSEVPAHDNQLGTRTPATAQPEDRARAVLSHLAPDTVLVVSPGTTEQFTAQVLSQLRRLPRETVSIQVPQGPIVQQAELANAHTNDLYRDELVPRLLVGQIILLIASEPHARALSELLDDNADTPQGAPTPPGRCAEFTFDRYLTPTRRRLPNISTRHGGGNENQQAQPNR